MPTKPKTSEGDDDRMMKVTFSLDLATLRGLDAMTAANPDLQSRSAAIRKLVREFNSSPSIRRGRG